MQECFNANPLTFVSDNFFNAPVDPLYPGRAYIPQLMYSTQKTSTNKYLFRHMLKLLDGLKGELVLLQWYYLTENSCLPVGYNTYAWPEGCNPGSQLPACGLIPPDGRGVPEQFWNCAEVAVKVGCGTPPPSVPISTTTWPTAIQQTSTPPLAPTMAPSTTKPGQPTTTKPAQPRTNFPMATTSSSCLACPSGATGMFSLDNCRTFWNCLSGVDNGINACPAGTLFDEILGYCNWESEVKCNCQTSPVVGSPTVSPTRTPTDNLTISTSMKPTMVNSST
jgi:hypothetical protein